MADTYYVSGQASVWIQPNGPNTQPLYAGCHEVGDISQDDGDSTPIYCTDEAATNKFKVVGTVEGAPGLPTVTLTTLATPGRAAIEHIRCPISLMLHKVACGRRDLFTNFERTILMLNARRTNITYSNWAAREPDANEPTTIAADFSAQEMIPIFDLASARQTIGSTGDIRAITFCSNLNCLPLCGPRSDVCEYGWAVGDTPAASAALYGETWYTEDGGGTWTETVQKVFDPDSTVVAVACFPYSATGTRVLVAKGSADGDPMEVAYSDDNGVTWTNVTVGAVVGQYANEAGSLYARDFYHIWLCTYDGYIYFSDDGGETWTEQEAGVLAATGWNEIRFISDTFGWVVGDNNEIAYSADGGTNWTAIVGTAGQAADECEALWVTDENRAWIGYSDGQLWYTLDGGATWAQRTGIPGSLTIIKSIKFANELVGFLIGEDTSGDGHLMRTIDGGYTWQEITIPSNNGLDDLFVCDSNHAFVAGPVVDGTGYIGEVFVS